MRVPNHAGYWNSWGDAASVDWCEPNYVVTPYVAEWWNTLSSLPLALLGLYGAWRVYQLPNTIERRFFVLFLALAVVGAGSMAFHGTLLASAQALDELPMIYGGLAFVYCLVNRNGHNPRRERGWQIGLSAYGVAFTVGYFTLESYFTLFIWSYAGIVTALVLGGIRLALNPERSSTHRLLLAVAASSFVGGVFGFWFPEHVWLSCHHPAQSAQLHSLWHLAAGGGTYLGILFAMWDRMERRGQAPRLQFRLPALFVTADAPSNQATGVTGR